MSSTADESYDGLSVEEKVRHKVWKARQDGYNELERIFDSSSVANAKNGAGSRYWKNAELFEVFAADSNVVAQESAVKALRSLLRYMTKIGEVREICTVSELVRSWVPVLVEKGVTANKVGTKEAAEECIRLVVSLDDSIENGMEAIWPLLEKKLPKLLVAGLNVETQMIENFGFVNVSQEGRMRILREMVGALPKLCSHADKKVRAESMNLILQLYTWFDKPLLQELLLEKLKPIQQRDLEKLFSAYTGTIPPSSTKAKFVWAVEIDVAKPVDLDGDQIMKEANTGNSGSLLGDVPESSPIDPYDMYPVQSILDKLPNDFYTSLSSTKWKDRVTTLEEFYDQTVSKVKKLSFKKEDYTELANRYCSIISSDANLQCVQLAVNSMNNIVLALRHECSSFAAQLLDALLTRSKEKKPSVADPIFSTLLNLAKYYGVEECLDPTLAHMKSKVPQVKVVSSRFLYELLVNWEPEVPVFKSSIFAQLQDISNSLQAIVSDNQQATRNEGFKCFAVLIKLFDERELSTYLEKMDSLKKKKILELANETTVKAKLGGKIGISESNGSKPLAKTLAPPFRSNTTRPSTLTGSGSGSGSSSISTIPTKRIATSPLKPERSSSLNSSKASRLTSRSLTTPHLQPDAKQQPLLSQTSSRNGSNMSAIMSQLNEDLNKLRQERQEWLRERNEFVSNLNQSKLEISKLNKQINDSEALVSSLQRQLRESQSELTSKDLKLREMEGKLATQETFKTSNSQTSSISSTVVTGNRGRLPSTRLSPLRSPSNLTPSRIRSPSESSDDLPRRVNSLNLNNHSMQEESWKRAAEVTNQLKARIERMRAKSRSGFHSSTTTE